MVSPIRTVLASASRAFSIPTAPAVSSHFLLRVVTTSRMLFHPTVNPYDGRVVSNFIVQALKGEDMTVYGDGKQTRSFQYIHDLIDGLISLMNSDETRPVNIGSSDEFTIGEFAELVREVVEEVQAHDSAKPEKRVGICYKPIPQDDPQRRRADTTRAKETLQWQPRWTVRMGLQEMVRYYRAKMAEGSI